MFISWIRRTKNSSPDSFLTLFLMSYYVTSIVHGFLNCASNNSFDTVILLNYSAFILSLACGQNSLQSFIFFNFQPRSDILCDKWNNTSWFEDKGKKGGKGAEGQGSVMSGVRNVRVKFFTVTSNTPVTQLHNWGELSRKVPL